MAALVDFPETLSAGDSLNVSLSPGDYPVANWAMTFAAIAGTSRITLNANNAGTAHNFVANSATTNSWAVGTYQYRVYATGNGTRETVETGILNVIPNFAVTQTESHSRKALRLIEAAIEGRAADGLESFTLDGQSLTRMSAEQLLKWRGYYSAQVLAEDQRIAGRGGSRKHLTRFTPVSGYSLPSFYR